VKKVKIVVDRELCDSHGICATHAPGVFEIGDDDRMRVLVVRPGEPERTGVEAAVRGGPKGALSLVEAD
jgi:ferredoxin